MVSQCKNDDDEEVLKEGGNIIDCRALQSGDKLRWPGGEGTFSRRRGDELLMKTPDYTWARYITHINDTPVLEWVRTVQLERLKAISDGTTTPS